VATVGWVRGGHGRGVGVPVDGGASQIFEFTDH